MTTLRRQVSRCTRAGGLALVVGLVALTGAPAQAAKPAPQLSIAIDDGQSAVRAGDLLTYAIVVTNVGTTAVTDLWVSQTLPTGLRLMSSDSKGVAGHGLVTWRLDLAPSANATMHSTMRVTVTPKELLRLAPVACASATRTGRPIVCASHSDQLPAGAAQQAQDAEASSSSAFPTWGYAVAAVVVLAMALLVTLWRRRATRSPSP